MSDKIEALRERHKESDDNCIEYESIRDIYADRATLLAEVDRQRAEIERLCNEDTKTRHALKGWVFVCPDGGDEPTHERVAAVVAEVERLRADLALERSRIVLQRGELEKQRAQIERLRAALTSIASNTCCNGCQEAARVARNALEGKP